VSSIDIDTLQVLGKVLSLRLQMGRGGISEVAAEKRLEQGAEDDGGTTGLRQSHPDEEDKLEGVVEGEPVDGVDSTLEDGQEGESDPISDPLDIVRRLNCKQSLDGIVGGNDEANGVDEESSGNVEEDQEEVESSHSEDGIRLGD